MASIVHVLVLLMCVVSSLQLDFSHDINTDDVSLQSRGRLRNMVVLNEDSGIKVSATSCSGFHHFYKVQQLVPL